MVSRKYAVVLTVLAALLFSAAGPAAAGDIGSTGSPDEAQTLYTMNDIYDWLLSGVTPVLDDSFREPSAGPASSSRTTTEIYSDFQALLDQCDAGPDQVANGAVFFSTAPSAWGPTTGSMSPKTIDPSTSVQSAGVYNTFDLAAIDPDLTSTNIKAGAAIYGVNGASNVVDTTSGDAGAGDILSGKKAWVDGTEIVGVGQAPAGNALPADVLAGKTFSRTGQVNVSGTMPNRGGVNITPGTTSQTITEGYHDGGGEVAGDADLASANIRSGVNIFGVGGDSNVVDTSSGDATADEILTAKKAWVDGGEITGNRSPAPLAATGQTSCWDSGGSPVSCAGAGQDGEYQLGETTSPRFTDNGDGTVTDNLTGLMWLTDANYAGAAGFDPQSTGDGSVHWSDAFTFVTNLNAGLYNVGAPPGNCGYADWRLPNRRELHSLSDYMNYNPALPAGHPFNGVQTHHYWTSTTYINDTNNAWIVQMSNGQVYTNIKNTDATYIWPVRDGL
jgi:hypothetical protein